MNTKIDKFGRIVLPKKIRDDMGLSPGTSIKITETPDKIILEPEHSGSAVKEKQGLYVYSGETVGDLTDVIGSNRRKRIDSLAKDIQK